MEILFRAKRKDNNQWIEGYYMKHQVRTLDCVGDELDEDKDIEHYIVFSGFSDWGISKPIEYVEIDIDTLGQYTGYDDVNGNKIFVGDKVRVCCGEYYYGQWEHDWTGYIEKIIYVSIFENAEYIEIIK